MRERAELLNQSHWKYSFLTLIHTETRLEQIRDLGIRLFLLVVSKLLEKGIARQFRRLN
ncbi:MAG: hypothetical protein RLZZ274_458 [Cyanobacteriota bacterium]